jgi:ABC-type antimicrobial peptide transport system permease subunit
MASRIDSSLARRRFSMLLLSLFASIAVVLSVVGIYGVVAGLVSQGTRELGIRMALGATPRQIRALVVRQGVAMALAGVTLGLAGAFALTRFMRGLLFGVQPSDPLTFSATAVLLGATALLATYVPARRASRLDLIESLRSE